MKIPMCLALLVAITLVCTPQAAVLATEATVVQLRLHGTYEDTLPPENPFGPRLLHFKGLLDLIREATADQNIAALYLKSESPRLGLAKVRELVQALQEFKAAGKEAIFEGLKTFLTGDAGELKYSQAAAAPGMDEGAARVAVYRMRGRYRDVLRAEIARTVADPQDSSAIEEELRFLLAAL